MFKVGDKVWNKILGHNIISSVKHLDEPFPIKVVFDRYVIHYTIDEKWCDVNERTMLHTRRR
ncbi:MAG: hypothetical protein ACRCZ0_04255 [Cetobacterium sp.]